MPRYISPLDETFIRFDAAAGLIARRDQTVTPDSVLELLVRAMWQGRFELSFPLKVGPLFRSFRRIDYGAQETFRRGYSTFASRD